MSTILFPVCFSSRRCFWWRYNLMPDCCKCDSCNICNTGLVVPKCMWILAYQMFSWQSKCSHNQLWKGKLLQERNQEWQIPTLKLLKHSVTSVSSDSFYIPDPLISSACIYNHYKLINGSGLIFYRCLLCPILAEILICKSVGQVFILCCWLKFAAWK